MSVTINTQHSSRGGVVFVQAVSHAYGLCESANPDGIRNTRSNPFRPTQLFPPASLVSAEEAC